MNTNKTFSSIIAIVSLLLLPSCASYKAIPLPTLHQNSKKQGVTLDHKVFDEKDCKKYLGKNNILRKGYQPIQVTITNNSERSLAFSSESLSLPIISIEEAIKTLQYSTGKRILGHILAGAFLISLPILALTCKDSLHVEEALAALGAIGLFTGTTLIASTTDGIKSSKANKNLALDFSDKILPKQGIIKPFQTITGVAFIPKKSFNTHFTFTLKDIESNKEVILKSN